MQLQSTICKQLLKFKNNVGASVLFVTPEFKNLPEETKTVISLTETEGKVFDRDDTSGKGTKYID